jgi:hypothetical protein
MHFTDPRELGGLRIIGSIDVVLSRNGANRRSAPTWAAAGGDSRSTARPLGLLTAAVGVTVAVVRAMVLDRNGCSQISFSCHSACEF